MKLTIVLTFMAVAVALADDADDEKYEGADELIADKKMLTLQAHCFIGDGLCAEEVKELKELVVDGIQTSCSKCSEKQKAVVAKIIDAIEKQLPEEADKLKKAHDPDNKNEAELKQFLEKYAS
uniref:Setae polypeptide n=1 Tax=Ochrogaster lunifer TaxID=319761 RepID=A0AA49ILQ4_OCHLU|nr:setae polypeptide [Ochrogaster lunifer]